MFNHTLDEIKAAFDSGERIDFVCHSAVSLNVISGDADEPYVYNPNPKEDESFFSNDEERSRYIVLKVQQSTETHSLIIESVTVSHKKESREPDDNNWSAMGYNTYYVEYNYNAGGHSGRTYYSIDCKNGDVYLTRHSSGRE